MAHTAQSVWKAVRTLFFDRPARRSTNTIGI